MSSAAVNRTSTGNETRRPCASMTRPMPVIASGPDRHQSRFAVGRQQSGGALETDLNTVGDSDGGEGVTGADRLDPQTVAPGGLHEFRQLFDIARGDDLSRVGDLVSGPVAPGVARSHCVPAGV